MLARELNQQNGVFARQPHQYKQCNLGENIFIAVGQPHATNGKQQAHGHNQNDGKWQFEALVLRRQHQEHQHRAQGEYKGRRIAGQNFLIGQIGPLEANATRDGLVDDAFDSGLGLARAVTRRGRTIDVGGRKSVVAHGTIGAVTVCHLHKRAQRHHLAGFIAGF